MVTLRPASAENHNDETSRSDHVFQLRVGLADFTCRKWWSVPEASEASDAVDANAVLLFARVENGDRVTVSDSDNATLKNLRLCGVGSECKQRAD